MRCGVSSRSISLLRPPVDWTSEREWRVRGDLALPPRGAVALVESWRDADEIYERFDGPRRAPA